MKRILALCVLCIALLTACNSGDKVDTGNITGIAIEKLDSDEKSIVRTELDDEDVATISEILSAQMISEDKGFVFAEGMYRIELQYADKTVNLYPYCGNAETIRYGDDRAAYMKLDENDKEELEAVVGKYIDITGGIWDWEEYEDN